MLESQNLKSKAFVKAIRHYRSHLQPKLHSRWPPDEDLKPRVNTNYKKVLIQFKKKVSYQMHHSDMAHIFAKLQSFLHRPFF